MHDKVFLYSWSFLTLVLFFSQTVYSSVIYVDGGTPEPGSGWSGTNGHSYSGAPGNGTGYSTIQAAVNAMSGGDDIFIRQGTYYECDILVPKEKSGTEDDYSSMQSYPGEWAKIDGQNSCSRNPYAVIRNGAYAHSPPDSLGANYWLFERLEITGGGTTRATSAAGIWWNGGPFTVRFCYIHNNGNYTTNVDDLPGGLAGCSQQNATIEFNYFYHNNPHGTTNGNARELYFTGSTSYPNGSAPNYYPDYYIKNNVIRYNRVEAWGGAGISSKANQEMDPDRSIHSEAYEDWGDHIHHNIVTGTRQAGIFWQQDYAHIYNNIIKTDPVNLEDMGIMTRKYRSTGKDVLSQVIYNNTIIDSSDSGIGNPHKDDRGAVARWYVYNNIIDNNADTSAMQDIAITESGWSTPPLSSTAHVDIDHNYIYRVNPSSEHIILIGDTYYTMSSYTSAFPGKTIFAQPYDSSNKLFAGTSGAAQYTSRGKHTVDGSTPLGSAGRGGNHPYLAGKTIPSYVGAADPDDHAWIAGVLNDVANVAWLKAQKGGNVPDWSSPERGKLSNILFLLIGTRTIGKGNKAKKCY